MRDRNPSDNNIGKSASVSNPRETLMEEIIDSQIDGKPEVAIVQQRRKTLHNNKEPNLTLHTSHNNPYMYSLETDQHRYNTD